MQFGHLLTRCLYQRPNLVRRRTNAKSPTHGHPALQCVRLQGTAFTVVQPPVGVQPPEPPSPQTVRSFFVGQPRVTGTWSPARRCSLLSGVGSPPVEILSCSHSRVNCTSASAASLSGSAGSGKVELEHEGNDVSQKKGIQRRAGKREGKMHDENVQHGRRDSESPSLRGVQRDPASAR